MGTVTVRMNEESRTLPDFVAIRADEQAWATEKEERAAWDQTLADGTEEESDR